jgi:hypothetical protein
MGSKALESMGLEEPNEGLEPSMLGSMQSMLVGSEEHMLVGSEEPGLVDSELVILVDHPTAHLPALLDFNVDMADLGVEVARGILTLVRSLLPLLSDGEIRTAHGGVNLSGLVVRRGGI